MFLFRLPSCGLGGLDSRNSELQAMGFSVHKLGALNPSLACVSAGPATITPPGKVRNQPPTDRKKTKIVRLDEVGPGIELRAGQNDQACVI